MLRPAARARAALAATVLSSSAGTSGGGGGGGVPSRFSRIHLPRITGDVRVAYDVTVRMLPCRSRPPRCAAGSERDAAEAAAVDVRNAVVLREPLVEEGVVGLAAGRARCGPRAARSSKSSSVSRRNACRRLSSKSGKSRPSGVIDVEIAQVQPLPGEVASRATARADRRASAAPAARARRAGCSSPRSASVEQFVVGNAAPQEERQPRGQLEVADAIGRARRDARRILLDAEQELAADQHRAQRRLDARRRSPPSCARLAIERQRLARDPRR